METLDGRMLHFALRFRLGKHCGQGKKRGTPTAGEERFVDPSIHLDLLPQQTVALLPPDGLKS